MSKIKKLKIKQNDGTWIEQELGANAQNIDYNNITLEEALNNIELSKTGSTIKLTKPDGTQDSITDTTYTLIKDDIDNEIILKDNSGTIVSTVKDNDSFFEVVRLSEMNIDTVTTPGIYYLSNCYYDSDNKTFADSTSLMMVFGDKRSDCIQLRFSPNDTYPGNSRRLTNWTEMKWSHWRGYVTFGGDGTNRILQKLECANSVEGANLVSTSQGVEIYGKPVAFIDFHYNNNQVDYTHRISADDIWLNFSTPIRLTTPDSIISSLHGNPVGFVNANNSANVPITCSNVNQTSSIRYKNNIKDITEEQANRILDIATKMFNYKISNEIERKHFGVIAEELIKIFPDLVYTKKIDDEEVPDSVDYIGLIAPLIKKIQMQQEEINQIKKELNLN